MSVRRFDGGTGTTLVSNGILLPPGLLQPSAVSQVRLFVNGVEQAIYVEALQGVHKDGSVRSVLVQFQYKFANALGIPGDLVIGSPRGTTDIAKVTPPSLPVAAALPTSADYLVSTLAGGALVTLANTASKPALWGTQSSDYATLANAQWPTPGASWGRATAGYEYNLTTYQQFLRTGDPIWFQRGNAMSMDYRTNYVDPNNGALAPWWSMTEGLVLHYWLTGDDVTRLDIGKIANSQLAGVRGPQYDNPSNSYCMGCSGSDGRTKARALFAALDARLVNAPYSTVAYEYNDSSLAVSIREIFKTQRTDGSWDEGPYYNGGQKNYMIGMQLMALARYYDEVAADSRILPSMKSSLDYMWSTQWDPTTQGFKYTSVQGTNADDVTTPQPALDGFSLYPLTWYAAVTGQTAYQTQADAVLTGLRTARQDWSWFYKEFDEAYYHVLNAVAKR